MTIFFVVPRMNNGGAERVIANLANKLCEKYNIYILTFTKDNSFYSLNKNVNFLNSNVILCRKNKISRLFSMACGVRKVISFMDDSYKKYHPDIIVSFLHEADLLTYYVLRKRYDDFKWISSERNDPQQYFLLKRLLLKRAYSQVDFFVLQSEFALNYYSYLSPKKKCIIPNPICVSDIPEINSEDKSIILVSVGRLSKQKNHMFLIKAFMRIIDQIPNTVKLYIYGEGPERKKIQTFIKKSGLDRRIFIMGATKNVLEKIRDASCFVLTSKYEGFPNALIEAMAMGLPVIGTDVATKTVANIIKSDYGILVPNNNIDKLANALLEMILNDEYRNYIRGRYKNEIQNRYSIDNIAVKWEQIFRLVWG